MLTRGLIVLIFLNQIVGQSDNRLSRRQRILSILESYQETRDPTAPTYLTSSRYNFSPARSGVAVDVSHHYTSGWGGGSAPSDRTPPPSTVEPPESPYDLWYYQDDSDYVQGPFTSTTMLEWQKAGYFRSSLLLRREVDNIFSNLATYTALYGRSPFSPGSYPRAIIVRTTPLTTTTTTTTKTTTKTITTTKSTTRSPVSTSNDHFHWHQVDISHVLPVRGDGILPGADYEEIEEASQEYEEGTEEEIQEHEATDMHPSDIREGSLRLVGGHDNTEVREVD